MTTVGDFLDLAGELFDTAQAMHSLKDSLAGRGAIVLEERRGRKDRCSCCLIEPGGSRTDPRNRMCTTSGAIGTLTDAEERELCDPAQTTIVADGRCDRAQSIRRAAEVCRAQFPDDNRRFFECFVPAFSGGGSSNPGHSGNPNGGPNGLGPSYRDRIGTLNTNLMVAGDRLGHLLANPELEGTAIANGLTATRVEQIEDVVKDLASRLPRLRGPLFPPPGSE